MGFSFIHIDYIVCIAVFPKHCTCKSTWLFQLPNRCACNHSPDDGHFGESQYFYYYGHCIVSILIRVPFYTCVIISLGYLEEESLSLRLSVFYTLIHIIKMSIGKAAQIHFTVTVSENTISLYTGQYSYLSVLARWWAKTVLNYCFNLHVVLISWFP